MSARRFGLVTVLAASAALGGCTATPYQPAQWDGGYSDYRVSQERDTTTLQGVDSGTGSVAVIPKPGFAECLV